MNKMIPKDRGSISALEIIKLAQKAGVDRLALLQAIVEVYEIPEHMNRRIAMSIRASIISEWEIFYKDYFGLIVNLSFVRIPRHRIGFERIVIMLGQLSSDDIITVHPKIIPTKTILHTGCENINMRPSGDYAIRVRNATSPDRNLMGHSANMINDFKVRGITLAERLIFGLKYFHETRRHLDTTTMTLCCGSRYVDNTVPRVYFQNERVMIGFQKARTKDNATGAREVIL